MKYLEKILIDSIRFFFNIKNILLVALGIVFSLYSAYSMLKGFMELNYNVSAIDVLTRLYGIMPRAEQYASKEISLVEFLTLFIPFTIYIYILSNYIYSYVLQQAYYTVIRYRSIVKWFLSHFTVLLFCTVLYFTFLNIIVYLISGLVTSFDFNSTYMSNILLLSTQNSNISYNLLVFIVLQCSSAFVILSVQYITSILKGSFTGFVSGTILVGVIILISCFVNDSDIITIKHIILQMNVFSGKFNMKMILYTVFLNSLIASGILYIGFRFFSNMELKLKK